MSDEQEIKWVTLTLEFSDEQEAVMEEAAQQAGMSLKCLCVHLLFKVLQENGSPAEKERLERQLPITLRKNDCEDSITSSAPEERSSTATESPESGSGDPQ